MFHFAAILEKKHLVGIFTNLRCALWGEGVLTLPRPTKMIKTAGRLRGKIRAQFSNYSNRRNQWWNNITTLDNGTGQWEPFKNYLGDFFR